MYLIIYIPKFVIKWIQISWTRWWYQQSQAVGIDTSLCITVVVIHLSAIRTVFTDTKTIAFAEWCSWHKGFVTLSFALCLATTLYQVYNCYRCWFVQTHHWCQMFFLVHCPTVIIYDVRQYRMGRSVRLISHAHVVGSLDVRDECTNSWLGGVVVKSRTSDSEVAGSSPTRTTFK